MELPSDDHIQRLVQAYSRFLATNAEELGSRPFVLPNGHYFPDPFNGDINSAKRLVSRLLKHAGLSDVPVEVLLVESSSNESGGGCGTGSCAPATPEEGIARLTPTSDGWILRVSEAELSHPVGLTTGLVRAIAHIFLLEIDDSDSPTPQPEDQIDIAAVALGLGPVILQGAYVYSKSCGGPNVSQLTKLNVAEIAVLTALFAAVGEHPARKAQKELELTQRTLLGGASEIFRGANKLVEQVRRDPGGAAESTLPLRSNPGFLARLFGKRATREDDFEAALMGGDADDLRRQFDQQREERNNGPAPAIDPAQEAKRRDLRTLVDEALGEQSAAQESN